MTQQEVTGTPASCPTAGEDVGKNATYESNLLACSCVLITADDPWPADAGVSSEYPKLTKKSYKNPNKSCCCFFVI